MTVFPTTCGVLFAKWTSRGSEGGGVVTTGGVPGVIVGVSCVAVPVKKMVIVADILPPRVHKNGQLE